VPTKLNAKISAIIEVSRQLLSQLELQNNNTVTSNDENVLTDNLSTNVEENQLVEQPLSSEALMSLLTKRQSLITQLFETYTQEQLSSELVLINEIVALDGQLTSLSQNNKVAIAQQVSKLKKSSKVRDLYKKY
jgi:hypothetical protein